MPETEENDGADANHDSHILQELTTAFCKRVSFQEAYPEIEAITVEVEEATGSRHKHGWKAKYDAGNVPGEFIPCLDPLCHKGGVSLGMLLRRMVRERLEEVENISRMCGGYVQLSRQDVVFGKCRRVFLFDISIRYKRRS